VVDSLFSKIKIVYIYILLRFSRGFTQSQFNSTINKFIYTSKTLRTIINTANKNTTTIPQLFHYLKFTAFPNSLLHSPLLRRRHRFFYIRKPRCRMMFAICLDSSRYGASFCGLL